MTIYYYELEVYKQPAKFYSHDKFEISEKEILAENDRYIVFNDSAFTKIEKSGDGICWSRLNKPSIGFKTCLGEQGVFYRLYSDTKTRTTTIEKQIKAKAGEEFGWFLKGMDLRILNKPSSTEEVNP